MEAKALCNIMKEAWKQLDSIKLLNVYNHWKVVLGLIIKDNDSDRLVECKRGKLYYAHSPEMEYLKEDWQSHNVNDSECTKEDINIIDQGLEAVE